MTALLLLGLPLSHSIAQGGGAEEVLPVDPKATAQRLSGAGSTFAAPIVTTGTAPRPLRSQAWWAGC
jgi:hypothetical protein